MSNWMTKICILHIRGINTPDRLAQINDIRLFMFCFGQIKSQFLWIRPILLSVSLIQIQIQHLVSEGCLFGTYTWKEPHNSQLSSVFFFFKYAKLHCTIYLCSRFNVFLLDKISAVSYLVSGFGLTHTRGKSAVMWSSERVVCTRTEWSAALDHMTESLSWATEAWHHHSSEFLVI